MFGPGEANQTQLTDGGIFLAKFGTGGCSQNDVGKACDTGLLGVCSVGTTVCTAGAITCQPTVAPTPEQCDGLDNNCNGSIDDGFNVGAACSVGIGACQRTGAFICTADGSGTQCNATPGTPSLEVCNGIDDDCNGLVDDGLNCSTSDLVETTVTNPPAQALLGSQFAVTDTTLNRGGKLTVPSTTRYYLSLDQVKNSGDKALTGTRSIPSLSPGQDSCGIVAVTVPSTTTAGTYYLLACADDLKKVSEKNENNNCTASTTQVTVGP